jgi:hypothetical protein
VLGVLGVLGNAPITRRWACQYLQHAHWACGQGGDMQNPFGPGIHFPQNNGHSQKKGSYQKLF